MEPADHDMYRAAIHGDLEAFELVIRNMSRPLFAIAFGALQNREEAEDVVQDAFVKAWESTLAGAQPGKISCLDRHYRAQSRPRYPDASPDHSDGRAV